MHSAKAKAVSDSRPRNYLTTVPTRDEPGDGFALVLMITVLLSAWNGLEGRSNVVPPVLTCCRMGKDHIPRPPPMACSLRLDRVGMSFWNRLKLPRCPEPVAAMSSGTSRSWPRVSYMNTDCTRLTHPVSRQSKGHVAYGAVCGDGIAMRQVHDCACPDAVDDSVG